jgi:HK97 family phage portal protein/HK97 family phage major capsid protein
MPLVTREQLLAAMEAVLSRAESEGRDLTAEETVEFDRLRDQHDAIEANAERRAGLVALRQGAPTAEQIERHSLRPDQTLAALFPRPAGDTRRVGDIIRQQLGVGGTRSEQTIGSGSGGGFLVPSFVAAEIQDLARNRSRLIQAGARTVPVSGDTLFPTVEQDPVFAASHGENQTVAESEIVFGARNIRPATMVTLLRASVELVEDSPVFNQAVDDVLVASYTREFDRRGLVGSGVGQQLGLLADPGIPSVSGSSFTTWAPVSRAAQAVRSANYTPSAMILSPGALGAIDDLAEAVNLQPLRRPPSLETLPLPWSLRRLRAAASVLMTGVAATAGRYGPLLSASEWNSRLGAVDDPQLTADGALAMSGVYACSSLLADSISQLPLGVFRRDGERRLPLPNHPASRLLAGPVNDAMGRRGLCKTVELARQLRGNGYVEVERDGAGAPVGLWPLRADVTYPKRESGRLIYQTSADGQSVTLDPANVIHIRGLSHDGLCGLSPVAAARQAISLAVAAEKFGVKFFNNDAKSGGFIQLPYDQASRAREQRREAAQQDEGGLANAHKPKTLPMGAKYIPTTIAPEEAQFLVTRQFQLEEICRWYRVPLVLVQSVEKTTSWGTGVEQLMIGFAQWTIAPLAQSWEEELSLKLLSPEDRAAGVYIRADLRGLLRGDMAARAAFYQSAIQNSWMTPNEVRAREELDPLPGGDRQLRAANMTTGDEQP